MASLQARVMRLWFSGFVAGVAMMCGIMLLAGLLRDRGRINKMERALDGAREMLLQPESSFCAVAFKGPHDYSGVTIRSTLDKVKP